MLDSASNLLSDTIADPTLVTEEEATAMGGVFVDIVGSGRSATPALSPAAAVLKLTQRFIALAIMGHKHVWFLPMLATIAERLQGTFVIDKAHSNLIHPWPASVTRFDGRKSSVDHVSPSTLVIALACSSTLMNRVACTLLEYMECTVDTTAKARAACDSAPRGNSRANRARAYAARLR